MPDHRRIYQEEASNYQRLIDREDYRGELLPAIQAIRTLDGLDVIDLGSGTGRLALLLAPYVNSVRAFDLSAHMLGAAAALLDTLGTDNWAVSAADHRRIPLEGNTADLVICTRIAFDQYPSPSAQQITRCDMAPIDTITGIPQPDGFVNANDLLLLQRMVLQY